MENASKKISRIEDRAYILCEVGNIMYGVGFRHGDDPIHWAQSQLDDIRARRPEAARFMNYMDKEWRKKDCHVVYCNPESPSCRTKYKCWNRGVSCELKDNHVLGETSPSWTQIRLVH